MWAGLSWIKDGARAAAQAFSPTSPRKGRPMRFALIAILALLIAPSAVLPAEQVRQEPQVYYFWTTDCPGCDLARAFFDRARTSDPAISLRDFDVEDNLDNATLFSKVYERIGLPEFNVVPLVVVGTHVIIGFDDEAAMQILSHIGDCRQRDCHDIVKDLIKEPGEVEQAVMR